MKVAVISTKDRAAERYDAARLLGHVTFIYDHVDPQRTLATNKFLYVSSDQELCEKIALVQADVTIADQVLRF